MKGFVIELGKAIITIVVLFTVMWGIISIPMVITSAREAKLINEAYGTSYSTADMYWTSDAILHHL